MDGASLNAPATETARPGFAGRWRARARTAPAQVGVQLLGDRLLLARLRDAEGAPAVETLRAIDAPPARRLEVLRQLKQEGVFRGARLHLLLAPGQYDVHQVAPPSVPIDEMHDALRWQLRGALGYPPEEALLDFASLPQPGDAPARQAVLVVTARRSAVVEVTTPFSVCGLTVDAVDVPEFAQRNLAQRAKPGENSTHAWLAFDQDTFLLTVNCLGELVFARRMLLPNVAFSADSEADPVAHFVERVVLQVQRSLDLFERQSGLPPVTQIAIGPHPQAAAVAAELGEKAAVRTWLAESTEPLLRAAAAAGTAGVATEMTAPIGAAMRALAGPGGEPPAVQSIDLQRLERLAAQRPPSRLPAVAAVVAVVAGLAAHLWLESQSLAAHREVSGRLREDLRRAEKLLVDLGTQAPAQASARAGAEAEVVALETLSTRIAEGLSRRSESFTEPLRALARARTEGVWLTGVRLNNGNGQLQFEGKALEASRVPQWLAALQREPRFSGQAFARIEMQATREPEGAVQFRIASEAASAEGVGGSK